MFQARGVSGEDGILTDRIHILASLIEQAPDFRWALLEPVEVDPVEGRYQLDLLFMGSLKRFALNAAARQNLSWQLVVAQRGAAVKNGSGPDPFQGVGIADQAKVILMTVLVENEVVQDDHLIHGVLDIGDTEGFTAVEVILVQGDTVISFHRMRDAPCADELCVRCDEVLAYAVRNAVIPEQGIGSMGDTETFRNQRSDDFVERLLRKGIAASLKQTEFPVDDLPSFFQIVVRGIVGGAEIKDVCFRDFPEKNIADVLREWVAEEVDALPLQIAVLGLYPILVGETQAEAPCQQ